jgi:predicted secreted protein with PEFG-CTERM motif
MKILVLVLVLIMAYAIGQYQTKAFGEISILTPPEHSIKVNGTSFTIPYAITGGIITLIQSDTDTKTIDVSVQSSNGGNLTITLPTKLIDAYQEASLEPEYTHDESNAAHFVVMNKNHGIKYTEVDTSENRTLTIPFGLGVSTIEIKGTYMIPEFGSMVPIILVIAFISIIVASNNRSKS